MYIGSTGERGLHHLVWEVVDNSVDEALAGFCDRVEVTILPDGAIQVSDNGRGIPVDIPPGQELPAVTVVLTVLHAGGKFGGSGYKVSGGLHGVGVSVVNALSKRVEVEIKRDGFTWFQAFEMGVPTGPLREARADRRDRYDDPVLGQPRHLRDRRLLLRDDHQPVPRDGVPEQGPRDRRTRRAAQPPPDRRRDRRRHRLRRGRRGTRPARSARRRGGMERRFKFDRGLVDYVEHLNRSKTIANPTDHQLRGRDPESHREPHEPRARDAVEHHVQRVGAHLRQHHQHPRGRHPRGGLPRIAHHPGQHLGRGVGPDQEGGGPGQG